MSDLYPAAIAVGATSGVASGIGKEIVQLARETGAKWLRAKYQDHAQIVVAKAHQNAGAFLDRLGQKVAALEQESEITKGLMSTAMGEPSFAVLLQKAVLASSQTGDAEKYEILSDLVTQRLKAETDSLFSVTSQIAVDAMAQCTSNQLRILGALAAFRILSPATRENESPAEYHDYFGRWLVCRFAPYGRLLVHRLDVAHLQSVGCLTVEMRNAQFGNSDELEDILNRKIRNSKVTMDKEFLRRLPVQSALRDILDGLLGDMSLTTVGQMIGIVVSDRISNFEPTSFVEWERVIPPNAAPPENEIRAMMASFGMKYQPDTAAMRIGVKILDSNPAAQF